MSICSPVGAYYAEGVNPVKIYVEDEYVRATKGGTGFTKCGGNYAGSLAAQVKAEELGYSTPIAASVANINGRIYKDSPSPVGIQSSEYFTIVFTASTNISTGKVGILQTFIGVRKNASHSFQV